MRIPSANRMYDPHIRNRTCDTEMNSSWYYSQGNNNTGSASHSNHHYYPYQSVNNANYDEYTPNPSSSTANQYEG